MVDLASQTERITTYQAPLPRGKSPLPHLHHSPLTRQWWYNLLRYWAGLSPPVAHGTPQYWRRSFGRWNRPTCPVWLSHTCLQKQITVWKFHCLWNGLTETLLSPQGSSYIFKHGLWLPCRIHAWSLQTNLGLIEGD